MKKGDLKRGQILDAAERLFFEHGYDRTSVQDILDALGLSKGGFYHYFDTKASVLREICERRWTERFEALRAEPNAARRSPTDRLDLLLHSLDIIFAHLNIEIHGVGKISAVYGLFKLSYFHTGIKFFEFFFKFDHDKTF